MEPTNTTHEHARLAALARYAVLDTAPEAIFDHYAAITAQMLEAPIGIVGMIDETRHWFKAKHGTRVQGNTRANSFCTYTVRSDTVFTVGNALEDARFRDNPSVVGAAHIRAYAGAPLVTADGLSIGTLCIFDTRERRFSDADTGALARLAGLVMRELEARLERLHAAAPDGESREAALDRAAASVGAQFGLPVRTLYGAGERLEVGALGGEAELAAGVLETAATEPPSGGALKLKVLERIRFNRRHATRPAPARALLLGGDGAILAHALDGSLALTALAKRPGLGPVAIGTLAGSAGLVRLPPGATLVGLGTLAESGEAEWLAVGEVGDPDPVPAARPS